MVARKFGTAILLFAVLFSAFLIRIQGPSRIPQEQFTSIDAYFYYRQAQLISEHGKLPARDMHRWLPIGRDTRQTLNLYSYALAYAHKTIAIVCRNVSLYHVTLYMPVVCFCIGLGIFYLFLADTQGGLSAGIVGLLLATLPGSITRSTMGFGDRDAWCLMLALFSVTTYIVSLQTQSPRKRLFWTLTSGVGFFLGGISWEGFGAFISIILCVEIWRFLSSETEEGFGYYILWVCTFVPTLYLTSEAYRNGYGFAEHLAAFVLAPPLVLLGIRALRYLLLSKVAKLRPHARTLALGLTLASIMLALSYVWIQFNTFVDTTVPLSQNTLMRNVTELHNPLLEHYMIRYGSIFILGCLGIIMAVLRFWKVGGLLFAAPLTLFTLTSFYRSLFDALWGTFMGTLFFGTALAGCVLGILTLAWQKKITSENEVVYITLAAWFIFWVALTRDAKRYDFFMGIPLAFFATDLIRYLADFYGNHITSRLPQQILKTAIIGIILSLILFWAPVGGHATRTLAAASQWQRAIPGKSPLEQCFYWIKDNLKNTDVVAANWSFGGMLNVLGGVKTVIDPDHYIPHWIYLYNEYVRDATNAQDALEFLKTHGATHLMAVGQNPAQHFLRGRWHGAFLPLYPKENFTEAPVIVWEIHYPPGIKTEPKHLKTRIPEIDKDLQFQ